MVPGLIISSHYLVPTAERLAPDFRIYVVDPPGYGRSGNPPRLLSVGELADSIVAWIVIPGAAQPRQLPGLGLAEIIYLFVDGVSASTRERVRRAG